MFSYLISLKKVRYLKGGYVPEFLAIIVLMLKGHKIIKHRYRCFCGEIDVVSIKGNSLIFTEVKYRKTKEQTYEAITSHQIERIKRAASYFLATHNFSNNKAVRFDAFLIHGYGNFNHLPNGF